MADTGIGASVRRKEDQRFITGKGQYTDDINRPGQAYAVFVRSPHAHANIKRIDTAAALKSPGCLAVYTGADIADRQGRRADLRLDDPLQGRLAHEGRRPSRTGPGQGALRRRPRRRRYRRDAGAGQGCRRAGQGRLRDAACRRRRRNHAERRPAANSCRGAQQHRLPVAPGRQGSGRCRVRQRQARHQDRPRQQPADPQRHRAARGHRRLRLRPGQPHALHHQPEPARGAPGAGRLHRPGARAQAARDRARRRRRLRLQDLHLCRGGRVPVGLAQGRPPRQVDRRPHAKPSSPMPTAATT